jgi:hypothetical protein
MAMQNIEIERRADGFYRACRAPVRKTGKAFDGDAVDAKRAMARYGGEGGFSGCPARPPVADDSNLMSRCGLAAGEIADMAEKPADWGSKHVDDAQPRCHSGNSTVRTSARECK